MKVRRRRRLVTGSHCHRRKGRSQNHHHHQSQSTSRIWDGRGSLEVGVGPWFLSDGGASRDEWKRTLPSPPETMMQAPPLRRRLEDYGTARRHMTTAASSSKGNTLTPKRTMTTAMALVMGISISDQPSPPPSPFR